MSTTSKFDFPSTGPDKPTKPNGQRGSCTAASLEKSGSFREGIESRNSSPLPSISRSGSTLSQCDTSSLFHSLVSDLKVVNQKLPRPGELKRALSSIFGVSTDDSLPASFNTKPLTASSIEEVKRMKSNLQENSIKARNRSDAFSEAVLKIDKYCHNLLRKRSRTDISSSERSNAPLPGGSISKTGIQSHLTTSGLDHETQKSEERSKAAVPNRRIRTSMVEVRANGCAKPSGPPERCKDMTKLVKSGSSSPEEKCRTLPSGVDGWENSKMKKKRSVIKSAISESSVSVRLHGDHEHNQGMQHNLGSDARPRLNYNHGFRSGPDSGVTGCGKLDTNFQQNGPGIRAVLRNELNNGSISNDRRNRLGTDMEDPALKAAIKSNSREDNCASSPTSTMNLNGSSRAPRSNSASLSKVSQNIDRGVANPENGEPQQSIHKVNAVGVINRKRSSSSIRLSSPSSPPVTLWGGQRPQKISRTARRSNLPPLASARDDFSISDTTNGIIHDALGVARHISCNASQQIKLKGDHVSLAGLSESEESGVTESRLKDRTKECRDMEEKTDQTVQKVAITTLPSAKNKVVNDEDLGDGDRRHGKIGRGFTPTSSVRPMIEKLGDATTTKQQRSMRLGSEKIESKPGRPPSKKMSERKGFTHPRHSVPNLSLDVAAESADDYEEILAAAKAALDANHACPNPFWKQINHVFGLLSAENITFLNQQISLLDESAASTQVTGDNYQNLRVGLKHVSLPSNPAFARGNDCGGISNGIGLSKCERQIGLASQTEHVEPFLVHCGVSICQTLLSAIIEEDDVENLYYNVSQGEQYIYNDTYGIRLEIDADLDREGSNLKDPGIYQIAEISSNGYKDDADWRYHDERAHEKLGSNDILTEPNNGAMSIFGDALYELVPKQTIPSNIECNEFQYSQMCISDRLLLELREIGLYPEAMPDLAHCEDEDIGEGIDRLEAKLHDLAIGRRSLLLKLERAVMQARELQQRELEQIVMDRLIGIAYDRYMACFGPNTSGNKNLNKFTKQAALSFAKRTLARCQKFETGSSCFSEPTFKNVFLSVSSHSSIQEFVDKTVNDYRFCAAPASIQRVDTHDEHANAFRSVSTFGREEDPLSNRTKRRELLLDDVVATAARTTSGPGGSLVTGTKGKRSERDREGKGGTAKIGRTALSNAKGERKNKTKPKQKTAQLSASGSGLLSKPAEANSTLPSTPKYGHVKEKDGFGLLSSRLEVHDFSNNGEGIDLSNFQLPDIDGDFGGQGQDIGAWLNIDDEGLADHDFMGLEIPMDDLSEVLK